MIRKIFAILLITLFLAACGKKTEPEVIIPDGFKGPTQGPDLSKIQPTHGPNDPTPVDSQ